MVLKNLITTSLFLLISSAIWCQQFSFDIYFEDAIGNRDTLVVGFDSTATDTIDPLLGETNILGVPPDTVFDVWVSDYFENLASWRGPDTATFRTKTQFIPNPCDTIGWAVELFTIDMLCKNWPVTISWDSLPFRQQSCLNRSILTDFHPGGWFDVAGGSFLLCYQSTGSVVFEGKGRYGYELNGDSVKHIFSALGDAEWVSIFGDPCWVGIDEVLSEIESQIKVFPNPAFEVLQIELNNPEIQIDRLEVVDINGRKILDVESSVEIQIGSLSPGTYLLEIHLSSGLSITKQFTKHSY